MPKFQVKKKHNNLNDGFSETLKYHVMHQANVITNHNKLYVMEIQKHPDGRYRIYTNYGRLGISEIHEVRETIDNKPIYDLTLIEQEFESIHKKKLRGKTALNPKTGKKEKECYVDIDTVSPAYGSENIRGKAEKQIQVKTAIDTTIYDNEVSKLLDQLVEENVHSITSMTNIKLTSNGYATELGPVTPDHVNKARLILDDLNKYVDKKGNLNPEKEEVQKLNSLFFSFIPRPFSRKISQSDLILEATKLQEEYDILDQLATGVQMGAAMNQNTSARMDALGTDIKVIKDKKIRKHLEDFIVSTKANNHKHDTIWKFKPVQYFEIKIPKERERYLKLGKKKGNIKECFHGSSTSNCLSILKTGLMVPPTNAPHVCGRMMGNGAYFALASTKSARYSYGSWGGRRSKYKNIFLFVADIALGNYYTTFKPLFNGTPKGYDSIWAKAGQNLYNDELVTPNLEQQTLKYMVELAY